VITFDKNGSKSKLKPEGVVPALFILACRSGGWWRPAGGGHGAWLEAVNEDRCGGTCPHLPATMTASAAIVS